MSHTVHVYIVSVSYLDHQVVKSPIISLRLRMFITPVCSIMIYGSEVWGLNEKESLTLNGVIRPFKIKHCNY